MANTKQAKKRVRQIIKRREQNMSHRSRMRTVIKHVLHAIEEKDKTKALSAYATALPIIDSMTTKGIIHRNKAARHKSRLTLRINALT